MSGEDTHLFLYANSAEAAQEAERIVQSILAERNLSADFAFDRWHPIEERWEDAAKPVPVTAAERATEHERLAEEETAQSQASGHAEWEVRVEMPTHHDAAALADRLQGEGHQPVRRWKYLVIGANDEDDARALAKTLEARSADAKVTVEPGYGMVQEATRGTVFAVFG